MCKIDVHSFLVVLMSSYKNKDFKLNTDKKRRKGVLESNLRLTEQHPCHSQSKLKEENYRVKYLDLKAKASTHINKLTLYG